MTGHWHSYSALVGAIEVLDGGALRSRQHRCVRLGNGLVSSTRLVLGKLAQPARCRDRCAPRLSGPAADGEADEIPGPGWQPCTTQRPATMIRSVPGTTSVAIATRQHKASQAAASAHRPKRPPEPCAQVCEHAVTEGVS